MTNCANEPPFVERRGDLRGIGDRRGERLLNHRVHAGLGDTQRHLTMESGRRGNDHVVGLCVQDKLQRVTNGDVAEHPVHVTGRICAGHEVDAGQMRKDARVVATHHAEADEARAQVLGHQEPAPATAFTPAMICSRSASETLGCTGSESTSLHAFSVSGRSASESNDGNR